jgi:hypothetical protein
MTIEDNVNLKGFSDDDVVSLSSKLYRVENVKISLNKFLQSQDGQSASYNLQQTFKKNGIETDAQMTLFLCTQGADSEILKVASNGWKKGKLKINVSLEFIPDEPEIQEKPESTEYKSPLDEIRNHPSFPNS